MAKASNLARTDSNMRQIIPAGVPDYLQPFVEEDTSLDEMKEYRIVPRLKIIQGSASSELKKLFDEGSLIVSPGNALLAPRMKNEDRSEWARIGTLFMFTEFCKWSDIADKDTDTIMMRSFDKAGELALKARDAKTRSEEYGQCKKDPTHPNGKFILRYVEHLNFICYVAEPTHPLFMQPATISFSRGSYGTGRQFISSIFARGKLPLWAGVWNFRTQFIEEEATKKYWDYRYEVPAENPIVPAGEMTEWAKKQHSTFKELFQEQRLRVDQSEPLEEQVVDGTVVGPNAEM